MATAFIGWKETRRLNASRNISRKKSLQREMHLFKMTAMMKLGYVSATGAFLGNEYSSY